MYNKKKSPNKFLAAGMAALGATRRVGTNDALAQLLASRQGGGGLFSNISSAISQSGQQVTGVPTIDAAPSMGVNDQASIDDPSMIKQSPVMPGGPSGGSNPFGGQKFEITPVQMTYDTPTPGNEMGSANPLFNDSVTSAGNVMFGDVGQRQRSLQNKAGDIQAPMYFKDQTGDGKITRADVIKARTEGYKK
jgi:hypothetical protein